MLHFRLLLWRWNCCYLLLFSRFLLLFNHCWTLLGWTISYSIGRHAYLVLVFFLVLQILEGDDYLLLLDLDDVDLLVSNVYIQLLPSFVCLLALYVLYFVHVSQVGDGYVLEFPNHLADAVVHFVLVHRLREYLGGLVAAEIGPLVILSLGFSSSQNMVVFGSVLVQDIVQLFAVLEYILASFRVYQQQ